MKKRWLIPLLFALSAAFALAGTAFAIGGPAVIRDVISGGGAPASGAGVTVNGTLGEPIVGASSGGGAAIEAGYWSGMGFDEEKCGLVEGGTYYYNQTWPVSVTLETKGTLNCLRVRRYDQDHPNATGASNDNGVGHGRYWTITGSNSEGGSASGFTLSLTLPADVADARACRYTGGAGFGWDCSDAAHNFPTANGTVTRRGITGLSDWAAGGKLGPTALGMQAASARTPRPEVWLFGAAGVCLLTAIFLMVRRRANPEGL